MIDRDLTRYQEGRFIDIALSVLEQSDVRALKLDASSPAFRKLKSFFKNVFIGLEHLKLRKRKITDIIPRAGYYEFRKEQDTNDITVQVRLRSFCVRIIHESWGQQYYRETYNIHIKYPDIIGIALKGRDGPVVIPAELCRILPDQRYSRKLPQEYTKHMVEFTSEKPRARMQSILNGIGNATVRISVVVYDTVPNSRSYRFSTTKTPPSSWKRVSLSQRTRQ